MQLIKKQKKKNNFRSLTARHMSPTSYTSILYPEHWTQIGFQTICYVTNRAHRPVS